MSDGWTTLNFGELGRVFNGNSINERDKKAQFEGLAEGTPYIATKDVGFDHEIDYESGVRVPDRKRGEFKLAPANSILVCAEGGSAGRKVAHTDRDVCFGNKLFAVCPTLPNSSRFVFYFCVSDIFAKQFKGAMAGLIGGVSINKFKELTISIPALAEQRRLVSILDEAFESIATASANAEKNLKNARALFESHLESVFARRGKGWIEKRLTDVSSEFGRGKSKNRPRNDPKLYGGPYPFIQTGDVRNSSHIITSYRQTYNAAGLAQSKLWPKGTLCITIAANIAETGILAFDACFPDSVIGAVVNEDVTSNSYLEYLLQSFKAALQAQGKGSAQNNINLGTFENQLFPFPTLKEQRAIVTTLNSLREETERLERVYAEKKLALDKLKGSLLHQAFRGQL